MAEWYVSALAGGGGVGSEGDPWTWAEMVVARNAGGVADGDRANIKDDATYTGVADLVFTNTAADNAWFTIQGYTTTIGDGGRPTLERKAAEVGTWFDSSAVSYYFFRDLVFDGDNVGDGNGYMHHGITNQLFLNCEFKNGNFQYLVFRYQKLTHCYMHDCTGAGPHTCDMRGVLVHDMTGIGIYRGHLFACLSKDNGGRNFYDTQEGFHCISDGGDDSGFMTAGVASTWVNCIAVNAPAGKSGFGDIYGAAGGEAVAFNCLAYNNDTDFEAIVRQIDCITGVNPQFVDPANLDYRIQNPDLEDLGLSTIGLQAFNYGITPGIDQKRKCILPTASQVQLGVSYTDHGVAEVGTLDIFNIKLPIDVEVSEPSVSVEVNVE